LSREDKCDYCENAPVYTEVSDELVMKFCDFHLQYIIDFGDKRLVKLFEEIGRLQKRREDLAEQISQKRMQMTKIEQQLYKRRKPCYLEEQNSLCPR
jgi:hypothetical protein